MVLRLVARSALVTSSSFIALAAPAMAQMAAPAPDSGSASAAPAEEQQVPPEAEPTPAKGASPAAEGIIVVGTRASLQSAIARKRNAGTVVDSIVADDIASFPDKNVGDALARITGVQLSRDFGEGVAVSIRGVEPDLNRVEINGVSQVSALGTRSGDFRELAAELVKSIDVYKGYSVDLTEGGIGGTVSVETRKPLELRKAFATVVASEQYLDLTDNWRPRGTLAFGTPHFLVDGLGITGSVTYDDVFTRQDYISNTNWQRVADFDHSDQKTVADPNYANFNSYASCANVGGANAANATARRLACETQFFDWAPNAPRYRTLNRHDKRISGDVVLQYQVAPNLRAHVEAQINNRRQTLDDVNYSLDMSRVDRYIDDPQLAAGLNGGTSRPQVALGTSTVDANHVVTSYTTNPNQVNIGTAAAPNYNGAANILGVQRRHFRYDNRSMYYVGGFDWDLGRLKLTGLGSYAKARNSNDTNLISYSTGIGGVTVDRRNDQGAPVFTFPTTIDPANSSIYSATRTDANGVPFVQAGPVVQYRPSESYNSEIQYKEDADWKVDLPFLKMIEFGGQYRHQNYVSYAAGGTRLITPQTATSPAVFQTGANVSYTTVVTNNPPARNIGSTYYMTPAEYAAFVTANSGRTGGAPLFSGLSGIPSNIPHQLAIPAFDFDQLSKFYDMSGFDHDLLFESDGQAQIPAYKISENIAAGYLKGDYEFHVLGMRVTGNGGVRYIHTSDVGFGTNKLSRIQINPATGASQTIVVGAEELGLKNGYTDWLPAFNAALEIRPNLVMRANWAKNLARPKPTDLVPNINCTDDATLATATDDTCTAGNPKLVPYRADQWELNLSWYPNRDTLVSLGYYKKFEKSFVIQNVLRSGVDLFNDGEAFTVRQPINGYGALLDGIEASAQTAFTFLPKPFDGFGASGNFTFARAIRTNLTNGATGGELKDYPGLSKYTWNASIFYDKGFLNARLSYNYRSKWLDTVLDANNGSNPLYRKGEGYLDGKITLRFPKYHISTFVEVQNINKEYSEIYIDKARPVDLYAPGRRLFVGVQAKF